MGLAGVQEDVRALSLLRDYFCEYMPELNIKDPTMNRSSRIFFLDFIFLHLQLILLYMKNNRGVYPQLASTKRLKHGWK